MPHLKHQAQDRWYVGIQGILMSYYIIDYFKLSIPTASITKYGGACFALAGVVEGAWALYQLRKHLTPFPSPLPDTELIVTGIYRYFRHPVYGGIITFLIGYSVFSGSVSRLMVAAALILLFI